MFLSYRTATTFVVASLCATALGRAQSLLWQQKFGGSSYDYAGAVTLAHEGGYVIAGSTASYKAVPNATRSLFIVDVDGDGNERWEKSIGSRQQYDGRAIFPTANGYMVFSATKAELGGTDFDYDLTVTRINRAGELIDEHSYGTDNEDDYAMRVIKRRDGGFVAAGFHNGDAMVMALDSTGALVWQRNFGGSGSERATGIVEAVDGSIVVTGWTTSPPAVNSDAFLAKFSSSGDSLWYHAIGTGEHEEGMDVAARADGGYVILGYSAHGNGDIYYIRTGSDGIFESSEMAGIPGDDNRMQRIIARRDGGFYGIGALSTSSTSSSVHLAMIDPDGRHVWVGEIGSRSAVFAPSDALEDADGSVIVVGTAGAPSSQEQAFIMKIGMPAGVSRDNDTPSRLWLSSYQVEPCNPINYSLDRGMSVRRPPQGDSVRYTVSASGRGADEYEHRCAYYISIGIDE